MNKDAFLLREATEYIARVDITQSERQELLDWVHSGRSVYDNPWFMADENGRVMDFIWAMREVYDQASAQ